MTTDTPIAPPALRVEPFAEGLFWESRVATALPLDRKVLARMRRDHLHEGEDWVRRENNAVALTAKGLAKIETLARGAAPTPAAEESPGKPKETPEKTPSDVPAGPPPALPRVRMRVVRGSMVNAQLLLCVPAEPSRHLLAGAQVSVKVNTATNFKPGMEFEAMCSPGGVWQFRNRPHGDESTVGRLPRRPGVW